MNSFVKEPTLQFALRELTSIIRRPRLWIVFAIVCAIFAFTGPFGTYEVLEFPARLGYWAIVQFLSWGIALAVISFCGAVRKKPAFSDITTVLLGALLAAVPIGLVVELVGAQVFTRPMTFEGTVWQIALTTPISVLLGLLATLFLQEPEQDEAALAPGAKPGEKLLHKVLQ